MLTLEDGFETLADKMDGFETRFTSGVSIWEASIAVSRSCGIMLDIAKDDIQAFVVARGIEVVPIGLKETAIALEAHRSYGKGRHEARLNMGDCFSYACAKANNAKLLYKGNDFSHTDLA